MGQTYMQFIKQTVRDKKIYTLPDIDYDIKVNQNENPYDLPVEVKDAILREFRSREWNRYPRLGSGHLRETIAEYLDISADRVMVGNGSNEILLAVMNAVLEPGKSLLIAEPTFSLYRHYCEINRADIESVRLDDEFSFPVDSMLERFNGKDIALTVLCSPNNPTGSTISESDLRKILSATQGLVVIDEAYIDFCAQDFLPLTEEYENLVLTRTFSKAFAFAFGRFGYGIAAPEVVREIYKVLLPYNLNGFSEVAAAELLKHRSALQQLIGEIIRERDSIIEKLSGLEGLNVYPSSANFFLMKPDMPSEKLYEQLIGKKILVRDVSHYPGLENFLRMNVGTPRENARLVDAITEIIGKS